MEQERRAARPRFRLLALRGVEGEKMRDREWRAVVTHFEPRLAGYFRRRADGVMLIDDLLQEIWLRAYIHIDSLKSEGALWTWLTTIGANLLRDEIDRRKLPVVVGERALHDADVRAMEFLGMEWSQREDAVLRAEGVRSKCSAEEWEFLNLLTVDELSHAEVAARLGLHSAVASRQRLRRLRERLVDPA
jgi:RNA polymerase sigma factor (sigma-70 family)